MSAVPARSLVARLTPTLASLFLAVACDSGSAEGTLPRADASRDADVPADASEVSADAPYAYQTDDAGGVYDGYTPAPSDCGDGERTKDSLEECDDGNSTAGDGCDARCLVEPGFQCAQKGGACEAVCGDGIAVADEACDDANTALGDGCSQMCQVEAGFVCPLAGDACVAARCGDGLMVGLETCDDGNDTGGDGCNAECQVETGWLCSGAVCDAARCGDGIRAGVEQCDDGNSASSDGCVADCSAREPFFLCPVRGGTCSPTTTCGDGVFTANEGCDDGNTRDGDGCSKRCEVESGFQCAGGVSCDSVCGDGIVAGLEQCDDGHTESNDGCSATCALEIGFYCPTPNSTCLPAICGNGVPEGLEQCDDGQMVNGVAVPDNELGDGCTPSCGREPSCANGACVATCGDGIVATTEACDDGNRRSGDGCSADCTAVEAGFTCQSVEAAPAECIDLPLVLRDFKSFDNGTPGRHPDFNDKSAAASGIVRSALGVDANNDGVADSNVPAGSALSVVYALQGQASNCTSGAVNFDDWYHDNPRAKTVVSTMRVCDPDRDGSYVFDNGTFFPLDGKGWQDPSVAVANREQNGANSHNFGFTSEVRFWFTFKGTEVLTFRGDDDVWVFINNQLAVDLGGVHSAQTQTITFGTNGNAVCSGQRCGSASGNFGLALGKVYEVVVFQAERHETASSYKLTLGNFISARSMCSGTCGDGVRTVGELCDDGKRCVGGSADSEACSVAGDCPAGSCVSQNVDDTYGHCNATCSGRNAHCGDGHADAGHEACDLGASANDGSYNGCNPDCTLGPSCGDRNVDSYFGETCDQGSQNADGVYGTCTTQCRLGARCGDGVRQADHDEQCDDGVNRSARDGCAPGCKRAPYCGDGVVQSVAHEMCDLGSAENTGGYGGCEASCRLSAFCGDGRTDRDQGEACDDGNANNFDGCSADCQDENILR